MAITLVTSYYEISSKHPNEDYRRWIPYLLGEISCNIIVFTSDELFSYIKSQAIHSRVHFIIKPLDQLTVFLKYKDVWEKQYEMDRLKYTGRTIGCYVLWNSKFQFLKEAIEANPFNSEKFIWNDIGSMRSIDYKNLLKNYPDHHRVSDTKLDIVSLCGFRNAEQQYFQDEVHLSGAIFGGGKDVILTLHKRYYEMFENYVENDKFIGCDQQVLSSLVLKNKDLFNLIRPNNSVIDPWFWLYCYWS